MTTIVKKNWVNIDVYEFARKNKLVWTLKALKYARLYLVKMKRKDKRSAFVHPYKVAQILVYYGIWEDEVLAAGILHDILEDVSYSAIEVLSQNFTERTISLVVVLTKTKGMPLEEYFSKIGRNPFAVLIKLADRLHNLRNMIMNLGKGPDFSLAKLEKQVKETSDFVVRLQHMAVASEKESPSGFSAKNFSIMQEMTMELKETIHLGKVVMAGLEI